MDRFFTVLIWILLLSAGIGMLRYGKEANTLLSTFVSWIYSESQLLAGLAPKGTSVPAAH